MKLLKRILLIICVFGFGTTMHAQHTVIAGGDAIGAGGSSSYSIGQIVYTTNIQTDGNVKQGNQLPYEEFSLAKRSDSTFVFTIYPNPTSDFIILNTENFVGENITFQIYRLDGGLVLNRAVTDKETIINLETYAAAMYMLRVSVNNEAIETFKVIKN